MATVVLSERNGAAAGTATSNVTNFNFGSIDAINLDPVANPIAPGSNSYEKYHYFEVTAMGLSSKVDQLIVWRTGALGGAATEVTNARTTTYGGALTYVAPIVTTSTVATQAMPTANPAAANVGIAASLTGSLTTTGSSDYFVHQILTNAADTAGATCTWNGQYRDTQ